jgi:hypothetical protein
MAQNEQLGCGCKVIQQRLGVTLWNRIDMCEMHKAAGDTLTALRDTLEVVAYGAEHTGPHFKHFVYGRYGDQVHASIKRARGHVQRLVTSES